MPHALRFRFVHKVYKVYKANKARKVHTLARSAGGLAQWIRRAACCWLFGLAGLPQLAVADSWTGPDKEQHFAGSAALAMMMASATQDRALGFWSALALGVTKEVADKYGRTGDPSARDLMVGAVGAYLGAQHSGNWTVRQNGTTTMVAFSWRF